MMDVKATIEPGMSRAAAPAVFERRNPITTEVVSCAPAQRSADVHAAAEAAAAAFATWSLTGPNQRRTILLKAADLIEAAGPGLIDMAMKETGGTRMWLGFNVALAARVVREAAAMTTQIKGEVIPSDKPGCLSMSLRRPVGVLVGMAPWNAPLILGVRSFAMPLACGNTVVMKASERCPQTHRMLGQIFMDAGLPEGVLTVLTHAPQDGPEVVSALIAHPLVRRINFTGSTAVGKIIAEQAGRYLKPVLLELGGKAPLLVLDDADIDAAVNAAAFGAFMNQGQICMSTERIIVDAKVADVFVARFAAKARSLSYGDPAAGAVLGSVVDATIAERVHALVEDALSKGAVLAASQPPVDGTLVPAIVLDHVTRDMAIYEDESFGPVVAVIRARDTRHAVELANDSAYGLSSAVFGSDITRTLQVAQQLDCGICHINGPTVSDEAQMPFGGLKDSGYGKFGGQAGVEQFTELRWVTIEDPRQHYPF